MAGKHLPFMDVPFEHHAGQKIMALECYAVIKLPLKTVFLSFGGS